MSPNIFRLEIYIFGCSLADGETFCAFCAVIDNGSIEATLAAVNSVLAASGPAALKGNWRLAMYAWRATMDAYTKQRFVFETAREKRAMEMLAAAMVIPRPHTSCISGLCFQTYGAVLQADGPSGARNGIAAAREMLLANDTSAATVALRKQMISLASALNESAA